MSIPPAPSNVIYLLPKSALARRKLTYLKGWCFEEKTPDLLALLIAHAGGASPAVSIVPQPPTLAPTRAFFGDTIDKKRKRGQEGKGSKDVEEGEVTRPSK